jgi:hypothetical protein
MLRVFFIFYTVTTNACIKQKRDFSGFRWNLGPPSLRSFGEARNKNTALICGIFVAAIRKPEATKWKRRILL